MVLGVILWRVVFTSQNLVGLNPLSFVPGFRARLVSAGQWP